MRYTLRTHSIPNWGNGEDDDVGCCLLHSLDRGDCGCFDMWKHNNGKKVGPLSVCLFVCFCICCLCLRPSCVRMCVCVCALLFWDHWRLFFGLTQLCNTYALPTDDYNPLGKNKYYNKLNQNLQFPRFTTECNKCGDNDIFLLGMWFSPSFDSQKLSQSVSTLVVNFFFSHTQTSPTHMLRIGIYTWITSRQMPEFIVFFLHSPFSFSHSTLSFLFLCRSVEYADFATGIIIICALVVQTRARAHTLSACELVCPMFINAHSWTLIKNGYNQNIP